MTLEPGDIITTGTPAGVGMGQKPTPTYLKAGDTISRKRVVFAHGFAAIPS
jgi:2-keto-4-pentenoate hydratase/2-oxohepta-3-ene-1,7-dioic acid hydratase in catechol pathway